MTLLLRLLFLLAGLTALTIGIAADAQDLVGFVTRYLSPDRWLSPKTARQVADLRWMFLLGGLASLACAIAVHPLVAAYRAIEGAVIALVRGLAFVATAVGRSLGAGFASSRRALSAGAREQVLLALLLGVVAGMALWSHEVQPQFHSDGINLQAPANLVLHGKYATRSNLGFDLDTHKISTGPAMLVPTALVYKVFGIRLQHAHKLALAFFLAFLIATYRGLRRRYGGATVLLGLLFFALNPANIFYGPSNGYVSAGMGESPALFYLVCGALLWSAAVSRPSDLKLFLGGVFWGLAFQSKWLFLFALPAVVATWGLLALAGRRLPSRVYLLPAAGLLVPPLAFFVMRISQLGLRAEIDHLTWLWELHSGRAMGFSAGEGQVESIFAFARPLITLAQVDFWSILGVFITLPALAYAAVDLRRRPEPLPLYLFTFTSLWGVWWFLFSFDLALQHLLYIWPFVQIYAAKLIVDGWQAARPPAGGTVASPGGGALRAALLAAIALAVLGKTVVPLAGHIDAIARGSRTLTPAYREMMAFVNTTTEPDAVFSGWDWSLPWWLTIERERTIKDRLRVPGEQREAVPEYMVITPEWPLTKPGTGWPNMAFANRWTIAQGIKRREFLERHCTHLLTTGTEHQWSIYRVNPLATAQMEDENRAP